MKTVNLTQGSPEWHAHRAQHWNASDAPVMLGVSPYKTRTQLLRERATGISQEFDEATQRRFEDGHRYEALARPLAESIIGEELYPCTGVLEGTKLSASFDGLTLLEDIAWEHKSLNDELRAAMVEGCTGTDLPSAYQVQCEQQSMVAGGARVLFMASKWNGDQLVEERHCWYDPNPELAKRIAAGWEQFDADLARYEPEPLAAAAPGRAPDQLPALSVQVTGMVTASNLAEFKAHALAVLGGINRELTTDADFANAEQTVKWCKGVEERLEATKQQVLGQTADIEAVFRTMDEVSAETRRIRLELDKLVTKEKENRKTEIVVRARDAYAKHVDELKRETKDVWLPLPQPDFAGAIKGKRTLTSMQDAVDTVMANAKIAANESARHIREALACLSEETEGHKHLFPDYLTFIGKPVDDIRALVRGRIAEEAQREQERLGAEREKIHQEEVERLALEKAAAPEEAQPAPAPVAPAPVSTLTSVTRTAPAPVASTVKIKLGDLNARIAPLTISADGLQQLGFAPAAKERGAMLYNESDFPFICHAIAKVLERALQKKAA